MNRIVVWMLATATLVIAPRAAQGETLESRMATELEVLARQALSIGTEPSADQAAIARTLLTEATRLSPDDPELWRLRVEAADLTGDRAELRSALSGYMKANPSDDAAQLRLIDLIVSEKDTAEQRLEVYSRLVEGKSAAALSPALRSRVAARAALLGRELNDQEVYKRWLKLAVSLDPTNRGAMAEIVAILDQKPTATRIERAQALTLLYRADPTNVELRWQMADLLHRCGLYEQALPWYGSAQVFGAQTGAGMAPAHRVGDWALCVWGAGQAKDGVGLIDSYQKAITQQVAAQAQAAGQNPPPGLILLPPRLLTIRALLHQTLGNEEAYNADANAVLAIVDEAAKADDASAEAIEGAIWARLLFRRGTDIASGMIERAEKAGTPEPVLDRLRGWVALLGGDSEAAVKHVEGRAGSDPLSALALVEALGEDEATKERRAALLQDVYAAGPSSLAARLAAKKLDAMGVRPTIDPDSATIGRIVAQTPPALRDLGLGTASPIRVRIEPIKRTTHYGEPIELRVELVNTLAAPLSLGPGGTVPSTVFLAPVLRADGNQPPTPMQATVVDMGRRLVLEPNEPVSARIRIADPALLTLLRMRPDRSIRIEMTAVLNPRMMGGGVVPGPLGASAPSPPMARMALPLSPETIDAQLAATGGDDPLAAATAAAWLSLATAAIPPDAPDEVKARADQIARQLQVAYAKFNTVQRAYVLARLVKSGADDVRMKPIIDNAVASEEPLIQYVLLLTQVDGSKSTILESALRRADAPEQAFAEHVREVWRMIEKARETTKEQGAQKGNPPQSEPEK